MQNRMFTKELLAVAGISVLVLSVGALAGKLESGDETRVAGIAAEMFLSGDYLIPRLNGQPFLEYPPLFYWVTSIMYALFGITDFAAKLPGVLAASGCVILTFLSARKLKFSERTAALSALILLFSSQFLSESRICRVDMMLNFFIQLSLYAFYSLMTAGSAGKRAGFWLLFCAGLTGGILAKGLVGAVLTGGIAGVYLICGCIMERKFRPAGFLYAAAGGVTALFLSGIWYALLRKYAGDDMLRTVLFDNNFGRFISQSTDHAEPFFYYLPKLPAWFVPWVFVLPFAMERAVRQIRDRKNPALLFPLLAVLVPFLLLCIASGKRIVYLLPLNLPCALLCGYYLSEPPEKIRKYLSRLAPRTTALLLSAVCIAVAAGDFAHTLYKNRNSLKPLFESCSKLEKKGKTVVLYNPQERTRGAAVFYLHRTLPEKSGPLQTPPENEYWIIREKNTDIPGRKFADKHFLLGRDL